MSSDIKLSISEDERHLYHHHHHLGSTNGVVNGEVLEFVMGSQYAKDAEQQQSGSVGEEEDRDGEFYSFEHSEDLERLGLGLTEELKIRESNERLDYNRNDLSGKLGVNGDSSTPTKGSDRRLSAGSSLATSANDEVDRSYGEDGGYEADQDHHYYEPHRQYHRLSVSHTGDEFSSDEDEAFVELLEKANHIVGV